MIVNYVINFFAKLKKITKNNRYYRLNNFHFKLIDDLANFIDEEEASL